MFIHLKTSLPRRIPALLAALPCEIEKIDVGSALGGITSIRMGGGLKGANIIIMKDGDRLTIRSAAEDADAARKNAETALEAVQSSLLDQ
ncbi:MAG: hypothetical protein QHC90_10805 [Shinella sp.]|nr:hypothetical protein [Shinella sp.]